jgi:hypothetical protein
MNHLASNFTVATLLTVQWLQRHSSDVQSNAAATQKRHWSWEHALSRKCGIKAWWPVDIFHVYCECELADRGWSTCMMAGIVLEPDTSITRSVSGSNDFCGRHVVVTLRKTRDHFWPALELHVEWSCKCSATAHSSGDPAKIFPRTAEVHRSHSLAVGPALVINVKFPSAVRVVSRCTRGPPMISECGISTPLTPNQKASLIPSSGSTQFPRPP